LEDGRVIVQCRKVLAEGFGSAGVLLNKEYRLGAAAEGFDSVGSRTGKEIKNAGLRNEGPQGGKNGGADAVLGGAKTGEIGNNESPTPVDACSDSEKATPSARMTRGLFFPIT
jgi:hypothetical protein